MNFGRAIRVLRSTRHISQKTLAEKTGLDASYISLVESNKRQPSTETLSAFGQALNVPVYLLALLASDPDDLKGVSPTEAKILAKQLLGLVLASEETSP